MRATVQQGKNGRGAVYAPTRPQETPPADADSQDNGQERVHMVQQTGDALAGHLDGCKPNV